MHVAKWHCALDFANLLYDWNLESKIKPIFSQNYRRISFLCDTLFRTKANGIIWYGSLFKKLQRDVSMNAQIGQWKCQSIQYGSNVKGIFDLIKFLLKCKLQLRAWFDWGPHWSDVGAGEQGADFWALWSLNWKSYNVNLYNLFTFDVVSVFYTSHVLSSKSKTFNICTQIRYFQSCVFTTLN